MISINPFIRTTLVAAALVTAGAIVSARPGMRPAQPIVATTPAPDSREYIVHWPTGTAAALADMDGVTVLSTPGSDELAKLGAFVVTVDSGASIDAILAAGAEYVEPNATFTSQDAGPAGKLSPLAADPLIGQQWHHATIGDARAWAVSEGAGVRVAVVDSGVGPHEELSVVGGKDFTGGDGQWTDQYGHGTHVAGLCCGRRDNGRGGAGVAPRADVLSARVLAANGQGTLGAIASGIVWAADQGAKVINLSLGGNSGTPTLQEALAYARSRGALPVCAAGNDWSTRPMWPAAYDDCLSVGSSDRADRSSPFTNRHTSIDISAPGEGMLSSCIGGEYCQMDGTSMAAPLVSGAAALLFATGMRDPAAVSWRLRSTAAARPLVQSGRRLDVGAALAARPTPAQTARPVPSSSPTPTLGARIVPVVVPPGCRVVVLCQEPYPRP